MGAPKITLQMAAKIRRDREAGLTYPEIGDRYGISKAAAQSVVYGTRQGWSQDEHDRLIALAEQWLPIDVIARTLHRSEKRCRELLAAHFGKPYKRPPEVLAAERLHAAENHSGIGCPRKADHKAHLEAIRDADCEGSPAGCGFPALDIPAQVRVAA